MPLQTKPAHPASRQKRFAYALSIILLFSLLTKLYRLNVPSGFYFDETYHAFTAIEFLHNEKKAYWPWTPPPPGRAYEWSHPPLGKLIMSAFMLVGGENETGWRIGSAIAGTASVALTAFIALEVFASPPIALFAAFLLSIDGLSFVQGRIGTTDSYFVCFALLVALFYLRWRKNPASGRYIFLTGLALGLAAATKWTTLYLFALIALDMIADFFTDRGIFSALNKKILYTLAAAWLVLPAAIYLASHLQFFLLGYGWNEFLTLQKEMWKYHSGLTATHPYQSKPWQWVLNMRPVMLYVLAPTQGKVEHIYNLGNSVIHLGGLVSVLMAFFCGLLARPGTRLLLMAYFILWLPWIASPRIMFFYHYMPALPFLCMLLAWFMESLRNPLSADYFGLPHGEFAAWALAALAFGWFALFYPHYTALTVPQALADRIYFALPGWK